MNISQEVKMLDLKNSDYLLPETRKLLAELIASATFLEKYVLVGGTALSLHLCHRKSEDLDFLPIATILTRRRSLITSTIVNLKKLK